MRRLDDERRAAVAGPASPVAGEVSVPPFRRMPAAPGGGDHRVVSPTRPHPAHPAPNGRIPRAGRTCLALVLLTALVTGCTASPSTFLKTRDSNYGQIGDVRLLAVHLASPPREGWPPGATVALHLTLTNDGEGPATLTAVETPAATGGVVLPGPDGTPGPVRIPVAAGATVGMQENDPTHPSLVGLTTVLRGGLTVPITFTLDTGEAVTLAVPAQISAEPATR